jgi:hypothetical protein
LAVASLSSHAAFDITINYTGDSAYQSYFNTAETYWESIITGYQSGISLTGYTITANVTAIDGIYGVLGSAGPSSTTTQAGYRLTTSGNMSFDSADLAWMASDGSLTDVIKHEMGHVIGIGTLWASNSVYVNNSGQYTGAYGLAEYKTEFNQPTATYIPVELGGGAGTANAHWNEVDNGAGNTGIVDGQGNDMKNELMTGWLDSPTFTSRTTIASLQDLGYTVNLSPVPEPETAMLFALGLPVLMRFARRGRQQKA